MLAWRVGVTGVTPSHSGQMLEFPGQSMGRSQT